MATVWKYLALAYASLWVMKWLVFWIVKSQVSGYTHAHVMRFEHLIRIELVMALGSAFIWARIRGLFTPEVSVKKQDEVYDVRRGKIPEKSVGGTSGALQRTRTLVSLLLAGFIFCNHTAYFLYYFATSTEPRLISWVCLICVGVWIHLAGFLIGFSILNFFVRIIYARNFGKAILSRIFARCIWIKHILTNTHVQTVVGISLALLFSACSLYAASHLTVRRLDISMRTLPKALDGLKIALLTDVHAGPTVGRTAVSHMVELTNAEKPDLVAIAGDLVDGVVDDLKLAIEPISKLQAKHGVFFTTGNHEMYHGRVDDWFSYLRTLNVHILHNEHVHIPSSGSQKDPKSGQLCLAGVDDVYAEMTNIVGHGMDLGAAVNGCVPDAPVILMVHNPKGAKKALDSKYKIDLILSGHTHAGQFYLLAPIMYGLSPYFYGLYSHISGAQVYVSSGVFYWGAPMKMFSLSQIAILTLRSTEG